MSKHFADSTPQGIWECELQGLDVEESGRTFVKIEGLDEDYLSVIRSGDYALFGEEGEISTDGVLKLPQKGTLALSKVEDRSCGGSGGVKDKHRGARRKLNTVRSNAVNQRRVLAVRVQARDSATTSSEEVLSDKIFGTWGDTNNLRERFATCSYGETQMVPFNGQTTTGVSIWDGVYTVTVNTGVIGVDDNTVREAVTDALKRELGDLPSQFNHVMICLPPKTNGDWIGYCKHKRPD